MDTAHIQEPDRNTDTLVFTSKDFRVIRNLLRLLSLWRPQSACFSEKYVYPVFINLMLLTLGPIRNSIRATEKSTWLNIELLYIVHEIVIWLGHILGNRYFASRDLETNVLTPLKPLNGITKPLNRRLKILNAAVIMLMTSFTIMLCTLFIVTHILWKQGAERFSAEMPHIRGPLDHILYCSIPFSIVYNLGVGLALFWTLSLLYCSYAARLKIMENIFLKWKQSSVDAVSFFVQLYGRPVKNSWKRISWWFLAHNIVTLAIPLYGYELAQAVSGRAYHSKHLPQFICYLIFIVTIWLAPTVVGELIKRRERKFMERINDISPWLLEAESHSLDEVHSVRSGTHSHGEQHIDSLGEEDSFGDTEGDTIPLIASNNNDISPRLLEAESHSLGEMHSVRSGTQSHGEQDTHSHGEQEIDSLDDTVSDSEPLLASKNNELNLTLNPRQTASQYSIGSTSAEGSDSAPTLSEYTFASRGEELKFSAVFKTKDARVGVARIFIATEFIAHFSHWWSYLVSY
ncbi:Hypothetical predicted protein [Paramuricea clavata]|uniref:Uncharacterized protein n=1 Tax=Paramuricea clavata TaxID=317549 RepID=A0A6S7IIT4_PARCT|nr:Hypothetical predicted protein [Paramuricea clavata]